MSSEAATTSRRHAVARDVPSVATRHRIQVRELEFGYPTHGFRLRVPELDVRGGERLAVVGPSGSGKTTLLELLTGIRLPDRGSVEVDGFRLERMNERDRQDLRLLRLGLVFQEFELLDHLDALDNVLLPYRLSSDLVLNTRVRQRARELLDEVGLGDKLHRHPRRLSQGERQRVAVSRALVTSPAFVFADEPTGNLDAENRDRIVDLLLGHVLESGAALIVASHDPAIVERCDATIDLGTAG